jgi:O-antigen/teichoic acid export membrane protein
VALAFILGVTVARLLGPSALAHYASVTIAATLFGQLSDCGLASACGYYVRHRPLSTRSLLRLLARHLSIVTPAAAASLWLAGVVGPDAIREAIAPAWFFATLVVFVSLNMANYVLPVLALATGRYRQYAAVSTVQVILQLVAVAFVAVTFGASWRRFIAAMTAVLVVVVVWQALLLWRGVRGTTDTVTAGECYRYGLSSKWAELMKLLSGRVDLLIVSTLLQPIEVGVYAVAASFREFGMTPLRTYAGVLQNLLVQHHREARDEHDLVIGTLMLQGAMSTCLSLVMLLAFPLVLPVLYGSEYAAAAVPASILFFSTIFLSVAGLCWIAFNMWGRPGLTSRIVTISGIVGPLLVWWFTQRSGLRGAAWAGVVTGMVACAVSIVVLIRMKQYSWEGIVSVARRLPSLLQRLRTGAMGGAHRALGETFAGRP